MTVGRDPPAETTGVRWLLVAIRTDLRRLHGGWMGLAFSDLRAGPHPVMGQWRPSTTGQTVRYWVWAVLGAALVGVIYPFFLAGVATRFYVTRMDRFATRVGVLGVVLTSVVVWTGLTAAAYLRDFPMEGLLALAAASGVATISSVLVVLFSRLDGRPVSILFAYPFGVTAVFLPPVVAALYSETLAAVVFARSDVLAIWLLDSVLTVGGINTFLRSTFELVGVTYVAMWFALAVPVGWALGFVVALADLVRPTAEVGEDASAT